MGLRLPVITPNKSRSLLNGLVDYWPLTEQSGVRSSLTGQNNLTDNNTVTGNPGLFGQASQFTNANSESLTTADNANLSVGGVSFTFCVWVYFDSVASEIYILSKGTTDDVTREYVIRIGALSAGQIDISSAGTNLGASTFGALVASKWYWVVMQYQTDGLMRVGVNNVFDQVTGVANQTDTATEFRVGKDNIVTGAKWMNGRLTGLGFWKRYLSEQELSYIYNNGIGRPLFSP